MRDIAYLIGCPEDREWVERHAAGAAMIAHDAVTHRQFPCAPYFFPPASGGARPAHEVRHLVLDWYRDASGRDRFGEEGVSFAQVISGSAWIAIASYVREWSALDALLRQYRRVGVSKRESSRFIEIARSFGNSVEFYDPGNGASLVSTASERRLAPRGYPLHNLAKSRLARAASWPERTLGKRRDTLYVNDWTYRRLVERDPSARVLMGRSRRRDAFPILLPNRAARACTLYGRQPIGSLTATDLAASLARIGAAWPMELLSLVAADLRNRAVNLRDYLCDCFALFEDLLDTYAPARIVLSGESLEPHTLLMQLARRRSVRTYYALDGYLPTLAVSHPPAYRTMDNADWLMTDVLACGRASAEHYVASGFPADRISTIGAAFIDNQETGRPVAEPEWDASIATWVCNHLNPEGRDEWTCVMVCEVASLLASLGFQRIAVKVKHSGDEPIYRELQRRGLLLDTAHIVWDPFQQHLAKTKLVVGGLSTGVLEAFHAGVPYYIYEPFENGYSDACLEGRVLDRAKIARTIPQLASNITAQSSAVVRTRGDLFDGAEVMPWVLQSAGSSDTAPVAKIASAQGACAVAGSDAWANHAAAVIAHAIEQCVAASGKCTVMLTGGRSAERLYRCWAELPGMLPDPSRLRILFGDERCAPPDHADSNYALAMRAWLSDLSTRPEIARIRAELPDRDAAARDYESELPEAVDILLLSVGEDGHIASLFPASPAVHERKRKVIAVNGPKPPVARLTVTPAVIDKARFIFLLATGEAKGAVLKRAFADHGAAEELPVRLVLPRATLIADAAAEQAMKS